MTRKSNHQMKEKEQAEKKEKTEWLQSIHLKRKVLVDLCV